jgi:hypothetical protein
MPTFHYEAMDASGGEITDTCLAVLALLLTLAAAAAVIAAITTAWFVGPAVT